VAHHGHDPACGGPCTGRPAVIPARVRLVDVAEPLRQATSMRSPDGRHVVG
jgi:hypothetical protein